MRRCCCSLALAAVLALTSTPALAGISSGGPGSSGASGARADVTLAPEGDPDGEGSATLTLDARRGLVCFDIEVKKLDPVVAVHIHAGAAGLSNEDLLLVDLDFANQGLAGCARAGRQLVESIIENLDSNDPEQFYLHVHSAGFSTGALRGQLERD